MVQLCIRSRGSQPLIGGLGFGLAAGARVVGASVAAPTSKGVEHAGWTIRRGRLG